MRRIYFLALVPAALAIGFLTAFLVSGSAAPGTASAGSSPSHAGASSSASAGGTAPASSPSDAGSSPSAGPAATPTPAPTPVLVPAPLTGRLVAPALAARHPIAVMVDDQFFARPQSGFTEASVVWQAPAEGGIPRYMMVFAEGNPKSVGPVRSSRQYYIEWASEWRAMYVHVGGSPQAMATLAAKGSGQYVWNADEFRWGGTYLWRITERQAPHNVYTDGAHLRSLAKRLGATSAPARPIWTFAQPAALADRPAGARIQVVYPQNTVGYTYDRASNTWLRLVGGKPQVDAANKVRVAPTNVVIMIMAFGPLNDGHPQKHRLEAKDVGSGVAWIATNGKFVKATWKKAAITKPTQFFDASGHAIPLTVGQTFIQVIQPDYSFTLVKGKAVAPPPATGAR